MIRVFSQNKSGADEVLQLLPVKLSSKSYFFPLPLSQGLSAVPQIQYMMQTASSDGNTYAEYK